MKTLFLVILSVVTLSAEPVKLAGNSATVKWDDPIVFETFKLLYGIEPGKYTTISDVGVATSVTVTLPEPGMTYYFAAVAYDIDGNESVLSNEVSATTAGQATGPTDPACTPPLGNKSVTITPTALQLTGSKGVGSLARQDFQVASLGASPIIDVAIIAKDTTTGDEMILRRMVGAMLDPLAGMWFKLPTAGTYSLWITAKNDYGCVSTKSAGKTITVH